MQLNQRATQKSFGFSEIFRKDFGKQCQLRFLKRLRLQ